MLILHKEKNKIPESYSCIYCTKRGCVTVIVRSTLMATLLFIFDASQCEEKLITIEMSMYGKLIT